jgi:glycosyltransferase involved in cell wall biosynthesis
VIENGVDPVVWRCDPPRLKEPIRVAYIGRLSKVKGIEEFLQVIKLTKDGPNSDDFEFHIVGDGSYSEDVPKVPR